MMSSRVMSIWLMSTEENDSERVREFILQTDYPGRNQDLNSIPDEHTLNQCGQWS